MLPAAGAGRRMASAIPKQYLPLAGRPVMVHALTALLEQPLVAGAIIAISAEDGWWPEVAATLTPVKPLRIVAGGAERCHSVLNGLEALQEWAAPEDWVLVHDAARPCLQRDDLDRLLTQLKDDPVGGLLAVPVRDTLKQADAAGRGGDHGGSFATLARPDAPDVPAGLAASGVERGAGRRSPGDG
jgi:2-C-methyl-D-erythritol 4-phosphate cytidylyltransferase